MSKLLKSVNLQHWLTAIMVGMLVLAVGYRIALVIAEFTVHTLAYNLSESYRVHVDTLGGYTAYIFNLMVPRASHRVLSDWLIGVIWGALGGVSVLILTLFSKCCRFPKGLALSILTLSWIGWRESWKLSFDPFWTIVRTFLWIICFITLERVVTRSTRLLEREEATQ